MQGFSFISFNSAGAPTCLFQRALFSFSLVGNNVLSAFFFFTFYFLRTVLTVGLVSLRSAAFNLFPFDILFDAVILLSSACYYRPLVMGSFCSSFFSSHLQSFFVGRCCCSLRNGMSLFVFFFFFPVFRSFGFLFTRSSPPEQRAWVLKALFSFLLSAFPLFPPCFPPYKFLISSRLYFVKSSISFYPLLLIN